MVERTVVEAGSEVIAGRNILYAVKDQKQYQLDSLYDSAYMIDNWFLGIKENLRYRSKVFLFGLGNGMYAQKILSETAADVQLFIYEPSRELFELAMTQFSLATVTDSSRVTLLVGEAGWGEFDEMLDQFLLYEDLSGYIISRYPNYAVLFPRKAGEFIKKFQLTANRRRAEQILLERHGKAYYRNTFSNIPYLYQGKSLRGLWEQLPKGIPAFVVSSGPSLDKNVEELKRAKGKGLIIAADSAVNALLVHDIIPDVFVSVDGMKSQKHFQNPLIREIPLICDLQSSADMMQQHTGLKFFIKSLDVGLQERLEGMGVEIPCLKTGGSVAHECFEFARILECNPIVLVGQDLAYTENHTHSVNTVRGARNIDASKLDTVMVEGIDGQPILSSYEFQLYLQWFEQQIQVYPEVRVIDATEGGAMIHGSEVRTLSEVIQGLDEKKYDFEAAFLAAGNMMNEGQTEEIKKYIHRIPEELQTVRQLAKQVNRDYEKMLTLIYQDKYHNNEFKKLYERIAEKTEELDQAGVMEYVQYHIQKENNQVLETVYDLQKDERSELIAACTVGNTYIKSILEAIEDIFPDLTERIQMMDAK